MCVTTSSELIQLTSASTVRDGVNAYRQFRERKHAASTIERDRSTLDSFAFSVGDDLLLRSLTADHFDRWRYDREQATYRTKSGEVKRVSNQTLNQDGSIMRGWVEFLSYKGAWPRSRPNPAAMWKMDKEAKHAFFFIPEDRFPDVLDLASLTADTLITAQRNRLHAALGLGTMGRSKELLPVKWSSVRQVADGGLSVILDRPKVHRRDEVPSLQFLTDELEIWRAAYQADVRSQGLLWSDDLPLLPRTTRFGHVQHGEGLTSRSEIFVHKILEQMDVATYKEGMHCLRRSGASAFHHFLTLLGYGEPTRIVSTMLGHSDLRTTENYLNLDQAKDRALKAVRASSTFGKRKTPEGATPLRRLRVV